jgi:glucose-6-phosphate isomerase
MNLAVGGMAVSLEDDCKTLNVNGMRMDSSVRRLGEIADVLIDRTQIEKSGANTPLYFMFRGVMKKEHKETFQRHDLRYDITVLLGSKIGTECNKTLGHYHQMLSNGLSYPEIYEVLEGEAIYVLQKPENNGYDVMIVHAAKGEKVLIPPNYGHVSVNPSEVPLVMSNLVNASFKSDYEPYKCMHGAAAYILKGGEVIKNLNYNNMTVRSIEASDSAFLKLAPDMYSDFILRPEYFEFLSRPELVR